MMFCRAIASTTSCDGESVGLQLVLVEIDLNLQDLAAVGRGHRGPCDGRQLRPDEVLAGVEDLGLRQRLARQRQLQDGHARGVEAQDKGGVMPGGRSLSTVCEAAVICARAALMLTFGWKKIFTTP